MSEDNKPVGPQETQFINLKDGTRLEIKMSLATLYYLGQSDKGRLMDKKDLTSGESMMMAGHIAYAVLRSAGKKVTFEEAMSLVPMDDKSINALIDAFGKQVDDYAKKKQSKTYMANQGKKRKKR